MPLVFKIRTRSVQLEAALNACLREQMRYFGIREKVGGVSGPCWIYIGKETDAGAIINKHDFPDDNLKNWIKFLGFSRIDGDPFFHFDDTCLLHDNRPLIDIMRNDGLSILTSENNVYHHLDDNMELLRVSLLDDHFPQWGAFNESIQPINKGKQIFSEADPYGEELWEDNV